SPEEGDHKVAAAVVGPRQAVELPVDDELGVQVITRLKQEGIDDQPVLAFERHGLSLAVRVGKEADLRRKAAQSALKARVLGKTDRGLSLDALVREGDLAAVGRDPRGRDVRISRLVARREKEADLFRKAVKGEGDGK